MPYPARTSQTIAPQASIDLPFRPALPGLVSAVVSVVGLPPQVGDGNGDGGDHAQPAIPFHSFAVAVRLEIFAPGRAEPVARAEQHTVVTSPQSSNRLVAFALADATPADLAADWLVRVTNASDVTLHVPLGSDRCTVTARYPVHPGNLGKIDHIVVLMMENRSFDHVLGSLSLPGPARRADIHGLTGTESNRDPAGIVHQVARRTGPLPGLPDTAFLNDPGHGWDDVVEQLAGDADHASNAGFVRNFTEQLARDAAHLPPLIGSVHDTQTLAADDIRTIAFRPGAPGRLTVFSSVSNAPTHSESGLLGRVNIRRPGSTALVATAPTPIGQQALGLSHVVTDAELATPGDWSCQLVNGTSVDLQCDTRVSYVQAPHDTSKQEQPAAVMSYYAPDQLPVYATLADRFCVADRWFAALPTDTWPNRLYALGGTSDGLRNTPSGDGVIDDPPGYTLTTMFEVLQETGVDWGYFFSDLPFALVFKRLAQDATYTARMRGIDELVRRAREGDLPAVTWVDPNFSDVKDDVSAANDDHPPGDMARGQRVVGQIYSALATSPCWAKTLIVITYDEHGGFYDHVLPPGNHGEPGGPPDVGDFTRYGLRVPTFLISPWVQPHSVTSETYDHTSLIATVFRRFCTAPDGSVPTLGPRAASAADVGAALDADQPHLDAPPPPAVSNPVLVPALTTDRESFGQVLRQALFSF